MKLNIVEITVEEDKTEYCKGDKFTYLQDDEGTYYNLVAGNEVVLPDEFVEPYSSDKEE